VYGCIGTSVLGVWIHLVRRGCMAMSKITEPLTKGGVGNIFGKHAPSICQSVPILFSPTNVSATPKPARLTMRRDGTTNGMEKLLGVAFCVKSD